MQPEQQLLHLCKILLDENRLKILGFLANKPASVSEIATALDLTETVVSRQLGKLREAGLVHTNFEDGHGVSQLDVASLHARKEAFFASDAMSSDTPDAENPADKVLRIFVDGDRLREIPAKHSKRLIILEWLAEKFEVGIDYPERTVNELLQRHHPDYAYLRRLLVDTGLMERRRGVYWRTADIA